MKTLLHIDSSVQDDAASYSRRISRAIVDRLVGDGGDIEVVRRDLAADPVPHISGELGQGWLTTVDRRTPSQVEAVARSEGLIAELKRADYLVIGTPMYNFGIPSSLKAWIDHVLIAGQTFNYTDRGPVGSVTGTRAFLALSRGGIYSAGPAASLEHHDSYMLGVLGFIGVTDVTSYLLEGIAAAPETAAERLEDLLSSIVSPEVTVS